MGDLTKKSNVLFILTFVLTLGLIWWQLQPPKSISLGADPQLASAERAFEQVKIIASEPHIIGSQANQKVRDYLVEEFRGLGLDAQIQKTTVVYRYPGIAHSPPRFAIVENVVARLKGKNSSLPAVALMSHYDSVPTARGAGDAASGTAAILEALRALKAGNQPLRDVIAIITDGEEVGLMGAQGFFSEHAWAKDIGLLLNFEARGTSGLGNMFETSAGNAWLTQQLKQADPYPTAGSLSYEIYKRMRNDTDVSVVKPYVNKILNFAFIDNYFDYHAPTDRPENLSLRSLQHQTEHAYSLTRHFANLTEWQDTSNNATYFNLSKSYLVHYSETSVYAITLLLVLFALWTLLRGRQYHFYRLKQSLLAILCLLLVIMVTSLLVRSVHGLLGDLQNRPRALLGRYNWLMWAYAFLSLGIFTALIQTLKRWFKLIDLIVATYCLWLILLVTVTILAPHAAYLFAWPLFLALLAQHFSWYKTAAHHGGANQGGANQVATDQGLTFWSFAMAGLAVLYFWGAVLRLAYLALGIYNPEIIVFLFLLVLCFLVIYFYQSHALIHWSAIGIGIALLLFVRIANPYSERHPRPTEVFYWHDVDTNNNYWASQRSSVDSWAQGFLGANPQSTDQSAIFPHVKRRLLVDAAKPYPVRAAKISTISQSTLVDKKIIRINVLPQDNIGMGWIYISPETNLLKASINNKPFDSVKNTRGTRNASKGLDATESTTDQYDWWRIRYHGLRINEPAVLEFELAKDSELNLQFVEVQQHWPPGLDIDVTRPVEMMQAPWSLSDSTVITQKFTNE